jgi:peroxiredoxin
MKPMLAQLTALIALASSAGIAASQATEPKATTSTPATHVESSPQVPAGFRGVSGQVAVGESAPGFELTNADGDHVRLSSFSGTRVLLCFAERRESIPGYRAVAESLLADGVRLVVIARDSPRSLKSLADREGLTFELLSDPTGEISAIYGSYDAGISSIRPGYVLVGPTSVVRMALLGQHLPPPDLLHITRYALTEL